MVIITPQFVNEIENWIFVFEVLVFGAPKLVFQAPTLILYEIDP